MKSPEKKQKTASLGSHAEAINKTSLVSEKLKAIYKDNILPSEKRYQYDFFYDSPYLTDVEFDAKPHVMLIGQYSVGKTSFTCSVETFQGHVLVRSRRRTSSLV